MKKIQAALLALCTFGATSAYAEKQVAVDVHVHVDGEEVQTYHYKTEPQVSAKKACKKAKKILRKTSDFIGDAKAAFHRAIDPIIDGHQTFWHVSLGLNHNDNPVWTAAEDGFEDGLCLSIGKRWCYKKHALDISGSYRQDEVEFVHPWSGRLMRSVRRSVSLPQAMYYYYFNPHRDGSFYAGTGLSLGTFHTEVDNFGGVMAHGALGYELGRASSVRQFLQLDYTQALCPMTKDYYTRDSHMLSLSLGVGF